MKTGNILLYGGAAAAAYFLFMRPSTTGANPLSSILPGATPVISNPSTMVGINSGVRGGNGSYYTCSNYSQLLAADPNLGNPNYQLNNQQITQYISNYSDLQQGLSSWIGHKQPDGTTPVNIQQAGQAHWKYFGCAEKRIYWALSPVSTAAYIPPPPPPAGSTNSSSGSWVTTALSVATTVVGLLGEPGELSAADQQAIFTMSAIIKDILPMYEHADPILSRAIEVKLNSVLSQYTQ